MILGPGNGLELGRYSVLCSFVSDYVLQSVQVCEG
jgi:hypothetical protein